MAISLSAWIICEEPVLPCVDNTECQLFTPSLEIVKSNYLLVAVMKSPLQETVFMEDYLRTCSHSTLLDILDFIPGSSQMIRELCILTKWFGFLWKQIY